jgi:dienelactone hydrolase
VKAIRWLVGWAGVALIAVAVWQIWAAGSGIEITNLGTSNPPLTVIAPKGGEPAARPLVLVGHGFAGSGIVMRGYGLALAHAGYVVVLPDFQGHGRNPNPLPRERGDTLLRDAETAVAAAAARGWGDGQRLAVVGHSMGSGVALQYGLAHPQTAATIAISPVGVEVTPELPRNLLLIAGAWEGNFVRNAERLLDQAGGAGGNPAAGTARAMRVVPGVEHVSILFSPPAQAHTRDWLDAVWGAQPAARPYTDRRMGWYGLGVLGTLLLAGALAPTERTTWRESDYLLGRVPERPRPRRSARHRLAALAGGALAATLGLWLAGSAGLELRTLLGLQVGGYVLVWFGVAGVLSLLLLWPQRAAGWPLPTGRELAGGLLVLALLWLGVGLLGQLVWLPWLLIPRRLILWPLGAALLLPWFLAVGESYTGPGGVRRLASRVGLWLVHSLLLIGAMGLALWLTPALGFLLIVLPLFPIMLGLHTLAGLRYGGRWAFALSGALFVSWLLLAVFPLQG